MLAQLVEHIPFKDGVLGSNPRQVTKKGRINLSVLFLIYAKSVNFKQNCPGAEIGRQAWLRAMYPYGCAGSSPVRGTNLTQSLYKSSDCVNKNLTATNLQQNEIPYKEAKLSDAGGDLSKRWHVYFSIWSDKEKKFKRKQEFISSKDYPTRAARTRFANELIALFNDGLRKGNITLPEYRKKSISRKNYSIEEGIEKALELLKSDTDVNEVTFKSYRLACEKFLQYIDSKSLKFLSITDIDKAMCFDFMSTAYSNITGKTYNSYLGDIRASFNRLMEADIIESNPFTLVRNKKVIRSKKKIWSDEDLKVFFEWTERNDLGMHVIGMLDYYSVFRPIEITRVRIGMLDLDNNVLWLPGDDAKNKKPLPVTLNNKIIEPIRRLIKGHDKSDYLISYGLKPGPIQINRKVITDRFYKLREELGIEFDIKLYSLKHTFNTKMAKSGANLYELSKHNRHYDIRQTEEYINDLLDGANPNFIDTDF